jgi:hypothetical protein
MVWVISLEKGIKKHDHRLRYVYRENDVELTC